MGGAGHVAKAIKSTLDNGESEVIVLNKERFDITKSFDYHKFDFQNTLIIDCIVKIDGSPEEINQVNYIGLTQFVDFLNLKYKNQYEYCYMSTYSTQDPEAIVNSVYVLSKYLAEEYVKKMVFNYKIIRLSYPFGVGEKSNRLFSRLIRLLIDGQEISMNNVKLGIMPISIFKLEFLNILNSGEEEINFIPGFEIEFESVVQLLRNELNDDKIYVPDLIVSDSSRFVHNKEYYIEVLKKEIRLLINEIRR